MLQHRGVVRRRRLWIFTKRQCRQAEPELLWYTVNDNFNFGDSIWYSPSVLNSGAFGVYYAGNVTFVAPSTWLPTGIGASLSGDVGYWQLGTSDAFYAVPAFPGGVPYPSYLTWDVGLTFTWKAFALDLRYYDTNLTKAECNVFTATRPQRSRPVM
jgi:hypothetical protein